MTELNFKNQESAPRVLVTGASGFIGSRFCQKNGSKLNIETVSLRDIDPDELDLSEFDVIVHLAAVAHRYDVTDDEYYEVNFELTRKLALKSLNSGVRHFVFMSSTRVYGTKYEHLSRDLECQPEDAVGKSKLMAELSLAELSSESFTVSIIRAPLVYGPGVKGNMEKLIDLVEKKRWLPLGNINNRRSMVAVDTLVALIDRIIEKRAEGTFLIQDDRPISTTSLILVLAEVSGARIKLLSIPVFLRKLIKRLKPDVYQKLFGSLTVDDSYTRAELGFNAQLSSREGIEIMIKKNENE